MENLRKQAENRRALRAGAGAVVDFKSDSAQTICAGRTILANGVIIATGASPR